MEQQEQQVFRSGQAARRFNRSASWLKLLEYQGIIPPASRDPFSGQRIYTPEDLARIRDILEQRRRVLLLGGDAA